MKYYVLFTLTNSYILPAIYVKIHYLKLVQ
jgi:hypothetical protein